MISNLQNALGNWQSIATEIRPSKNPDGSIKPLYLKRAFTALEGDKFELTVTSMADPNGKLPLAQMFIKGSIEWKGDHPVAEGAQKVDFSADEVYTSLQCYRALLTF